VHVPSSLLTIGQLSPFQVLKPREKAILEDDHPPTSDRGT
jgi:hypothetical protein